MDPSIFNIASSWLHVVSIIVIVWLIPTVLIEKLELDLNARTTVCTARCQAIHDK